jgi:hypothetical protein
MRIDRTAVIQEAKHSFSLEELADRLDATPSERFWEFIGKVCPGFDKLVERNRIFAEVHRLKQRGEEVLAHAMRREGISLTAQIMQLGLNGNVVMAAPPTETHADKDPKESSDVPEVPKAKKTQKPKFSVEDRAALKPIDKSTLLCEAARDMVLGLLDETYLGRSIVMIEINPTVFVDEESTRRTIRKYTVHNGIINHSDIRQGELPTTYWVTMDAMSHLGTFTKDDVINLAFDRMVKAGWAPGKDYDTEELLKKACGIAFDVLKTHHSHPTKKKSCMTHMCEELMHGKKGKKAFKIRGRKTHETLSHFEKTKAELVNAEVDGKPLKTVTVRDA